MTVCVKLQEQVGVTLSYTTNTASCRMPMNASDLLFTRIIVQGLILVNNRIDAFIGCQNQQGWTAGE